MLTQRPQGLVSVAGKSAEQYCTVDARFMAAQAPARGHVFESGMTAQVLFPHNHDVLDVPRAATPDMNSSPLWTPGNTRDARTSRFMRTVNAKHSLSLSSYDELWTWSTANIGKFWDLVWQETGILGERGPSVRTHGPSLGQILIIDQ